MVSIGHSLTRTHPNPLNGEVITESSIQSLIERVAPKFADQIEADLLHAPLNLSSLCRLSSLPRNVTEQISDAILTIQDIPSDQEVFDWAVFDNSHKCRGVSNFAKNAILARRARTDCLTSENDYRRAKEVVNEIETNRIELSAEDRMHVQLMNMRLFRELKQELFYQISKENAAKYRPHEHQRSDFAAGFAFSISHHTSETHYYAEPLSPIRFPISSSDKLLRPNYWDDKEKIQKIMKVSFNIYADAPGYLLIHNRDFPLAIASFHVDVGGVLVVRQMQQIKPEGKALNNKTMTRGNCYDLGEIDWRQLMIKEGIVPLCKSLGIQTLAIDHRAPIEWGRSSNRVSEIFDPRVPCRLMRKAAKSLGMEYQPEFKWYGSNIETLR